MSDASTKTMIREYVEEADAPMFLSGEFQSPPENFHDSEKVEIDIERDDEDVAIVIQDLTTGARSNESTKYTNKAWTPPIFNEDGVVNAFELIKRMPGENPFKNPDFQAHATLQAFKIFRKLERKVKRAVELMSSQVLQTGELTCIDSAGVELYKLDFQPRTTHFPTVSTTWSEDGATGNPLLNLESLADVIRANGHKSPDKLMFGSTALRRFLKNTAVAARLDNLRMKLGKVQPDSRGEGAKFQGYVWIGNYRFEMWSYDATYKHQQTGVVTPFIHPEKVVMRASSGRLDLSFGSIPRLTSPDSRALPYLPPRISDGARAVDMTTNAWLSVDGTALHVSAGTRPLAIPTAIDTFGCLDMTA